MAPEHNQNEEEEEEQTGKLAIRLANAVVLPMVLKSAMELKIIDMISTSEKPLSASHIASQIQAKNPEAPILIQRMLSLLASYDILKCSLIATKETDEAFYSSRPICKFLTTNQSPAQGSIAPLFLYHHDEVFMKSWYHLNDTILEGGLPFNRAYGMSVFEYAGNDQRFNGAFNQAMSNHTTLLINNLLYVYNGFDNLNVLVDVGGGIGVTLSIITSKYPNIKAINFDLPHVLDNASSYPGVEHVGGDMFVSVPKGDAIFMKWILHDWSDEDCLKHLKNCYEALPNGRKVIVVESIRPVIPENVVSSHIVHEQDLFMLAQTHGGKERTQKEFESLAFKSGFSSCQVICCAYNSWVLEFHKP